MTRQEFLSKISDKYPDMVVSTMRIDGMPSVFVMPSMTLERVRDQGTREVFSAASFVLTGEVLAKDEFGLFLKERT